MKRVSVLLSLSLLAASLCGCVPQLCLFPLHTQEDKEFDQRLLGVWRFVDPDEPEEKSDTGILTLSRDGDEPVYRVFTSGNGGDKKKEEPGLSTKARLVKLGETWFLDFEAPDDSEMDAKYVPYPVIQAHAIARVRLEKETLRLDFLSDDWLRAGIKVGKPALPAVETEDGYAVTAPTAELRKFALAHAQDDKAFGERFLLKRMH